MNSKPLAALQNEIVTELNLASAAFGWLRENFVHLAGAVVVLVVGVIAVKLLSRTADRALTRSGRIEPTVAKFTRQHDSNMRCGQWCW